MTMKIRINHKSSVSGASWCTPIGWEPDNQIEEAEFVDGSWWSEESEEAGLLYFGEAQEGEEIEASFADLRVASCGDCRVIGEVESSNAVPK
jgi:hypothetical protein